ncbi:hypothetical protein [Sphingomonas sp. 28-63-12]|uniref:hypothetical protein n=1 Tax=Sphingomonas sp. 28-63-12 TaxID=1970434 RepID=UPI000BDC0B6D|nr:MAG: hypothetical protein B7Y47_15330 [Sphingomonas sp. 28-63-12]
MRRSMLMLMLCALPLAGCGDAGKDGTTISIKSGGADGNVIAGVDGKTGEVAINTPGFSGKLTLPKLSLNSSDFDLNGVHLYPGSTISGMNIVAHDGKNGSDKSQVRITFDSPAAPAIVRDWFFDKLGKAKFTLTKDGTGLTGKDDEKKPFKLELTPAANGHSTGVIVAGGEDLADRRGCVQKRCRILAVLDQPPLARV